MKFNILMCLFLSLAMISKANNASDSSAPNKKIIGMYMHQHWSYNNPYAVRTWTLDNWKGYLDGLSRLGYNTILIWPVLETMPDPLTQSDKDNLTKIAKVIDMAHNDYKMRVYIALCPNVSAKNEEAKKYTFEKRPFFRTDDRVDPGDPVAFGKLMNLREKLLAPLAKADGLFIIDSDPGGYPYSTNYEFAYILGAHRRILDRLRPGIEVYYWAHFGWEAYSKFYATGDLIFGKPSEPREVMELLSRNKVNEPWGIASGSFGPHIGDSINMADRVLSYPYGMIEGEPSFPLTNYNDGRPQEAAALAASRGVLGNAQTHIVQLPNTFAFARAAQGLSVNKSDYIDFANEIIKGKGQLIVDGWEALRGTDVKKMKAASAKLSALEKSAIQTGKYEGLLFGNPKSFINDLVLQLNAMSTLHDFINTINADSTNKQKIKKSFAPFVTAIEKWQMKHGYSNHWNWDNMHQALRKIHSKQLDDTLNTLTWLSEEGETQFDKVKNGLARLETFTPRLIESMKKALAEMK